MASITRVDTTGASTWCHNCGELLIYHENDFEGGVGAWSLGGDWQWGTPNGYTTAGSLEPSSAHGGFSCIGTIMNGSYNYNGSYNIDPYMADSDGSLIQVNAYVDDYDTGACP